MNDTSNNGKLARRALMIAALLGFTAVAFGAFGAHGVKDHIAPDLFEVYQTGALYHLTHAIALLGISVWLRWAPRRRLLHIAGMCFTAGVIIFSGTLYGLALSGQRWLGAITPIGGVMLLVGWALTFASAWRAIDQSETQQAEV